MFRRRIPGTEEEGRCPLVGTSISCLRCPKGTEMLPPRRPGPWQRSQWMRTGFVQSWSHATNRNGSECIPASLNFPDPPSSAIANARLRERDPRSCVTRVPLDYRPEEDHAELVDSYGPGLVLLSQQDSAPWREPYGRDTAPGRRWLRQSRL